MESFRSHTESRNSPMICVSIGRTRHKMMMMEHRSLSEKGAELVELRLDWIARTPDVTKLIKDRPTPVVITCRRPEDKGRWKGSEEQRQALLRTAIVSEVEYVDIEDDIADKIPRYGKTKRIISHHNFDETPDNLEEIHESLCKKDPDIVKLVTMANSPGDSIRMLKLVASAKVPTVGFCMGEYGVISRILCGKYGSPFTYATFSREREMAPGQLAFSEMTQIYRYDQIGPETPVYGVIGDPIAHSLSPLIHNIAFRHDKLDGVYLPFRVPKDRLEETLKEFEFLNVQGYSVTIPHKEGALKLAGDADEASKTMGVANTLFKDDQNVWQARNTDYDAALDSIRLGLDPEGKASDDPIDGKQVLLLGAGGVSRAIGAGIINAGGALTVTNRSRVRGEKLAQDLGCAHTTWENRGSGHFDILVNGTSVGMHPNVNETPFAQNFLLDDMLVFDTVYNPENTLLLKQARERGCKTVSGIEMFVRQAAAQYKLFTGKEAPLDVMRNTLRKGISAVAKL